VDAGSYVTCCERRRARGAPEPGLSLLTAVSDQLGLRLQTRKVPVDLVIVDHMERVTTEN
jgi:uncharacterized protein (TIGR03435 family)